VRSRLSGRQAASATAALPFPSPRRLGGEARDTAAGAYAGEPGPKARRGRSAQRSGGGNPGATCTRLGFSLKLVRTAEAYCRVRREPRPRPGAGVRRRAPAAGHDGNDADAAANAVKSAVPATGGGSAALNIAVEKRTSGDLSR
jgi:hypothetical protein